MKRLFGDIIFIVCGMVAAAIGWRVETPKEYGNRYALSYTPKQDEGIKRRRR